MKEIEPKNYIQIDSDFITVMLFEDMNKENKYVIDTLLYLLNELSSALNDDGELTRYTVHITQNEVSHILTYDVVNKKKRRVSKMKELKEIIFRKLGTTVSIIENKKETKIFMFDTFQYMVDKKSISITFNPTFISYFKRCRNTKAGYFKLYLDVMISLSTMNSKIMYSLCSRYDDQISKHKYTNATTVNMLKFYFDDNKEYDLEFKDYRYSITNQNLKKNVETSIKAINELIKTKNAVNHTNFPGYEVEWIYIKSQSSKNRNGELDKFRIKHILLESDNTSKQTPKPKESKPKNKTQSCKDMYEIVESALDGEDVKLNYKLITGWWLHKYFLTNNMKYSGNFAENIGKIKNIAVKFNKTDDLLSLVRFMNDFESKYHKVFEDNVTLSTYAVDWKVQKVLNGGEQRRSYNNVQTDYVPNTKSRRV